MKRLIYNILIFTFYFTVFFFFGYRVVCEKVPRNVLIFTGIFLGFLILRNFSKFIMFSLLNTYKKLKNLNPEDKGKIAIYVKKKTEKLDNFIEKEFKANFLYRYDFISRLSLGCLKFYEKNQERFHYYFIIFFVLPWIISLIFYIAEIFYSGDLYFSLYLFPLTILIRRIFYDLFLSTVVFESKRILDSKYEYYFPVFFKQFVTLKEFFLVNFQIRSDFLFHQPKFKNKEDLLFFWNLFNELIYNNLIYRILINFDRPVCYHFRKFVLKFNGILYTFTVLFILSSKLVVLKDSVYLDLVLVFLTFFLVFFLFLSFLSFLNSFELEENNNNYTDYFGNSENLRDFFANSLMNDKKCLLKTYPFLKGQDLKYALGYPSVKRMHKERNSPIFSTMSLENFEESLKIQRLIAVWFFKVFQKGEIDMSTFSYREKK